MTALDFLASYEALHDEVVAFELSRDVVVVSGDDARSYLDGQCTQDLRALEVGTTGETFILSPQGKIDVYARVVFAAETLAYVVVEAGFGEVTFERLRRFKLRVRVELALETKRAIALFAPGTSKHLLGQATFALRMDWPGTSGIELFGVTEDALGEVPLGDVGAFEVARIEAGIPAMGKELTDKIIPQETGITARTVSFTKGCYTGQELVARIDARGNRVPKQLRRIVGAGNDIAPGDVILGDGGEKGELTSVGFSPRMDRMVALGYVRREIVPPATGRIEKSGQRTIEVTIEELPLVSKASAPKG